MPGNSRIFISHSSADRALTGDICSALSAAPAGEHGYKTIVDYEVLVDYDNLVAGTAWPKQLHLWMAHCHAAVLLLTADAVRSPWVLKEATILSWRLSLDENFRLFTVRYPNATDALLTEHKFDPLDLGQIQQVAAESPTDIATKVRESVGEPVQNSTPFDKLVGLLSDLFGHVGENTLAGLADKVCAEGLPWQPDADPRTQYAEKISAKLLSEDLGGLEGIDELVDSLSVATTAEIVKKILDVTACYWVDAAAAGRLPALACSDPRRAAAMNGAAVSDYTGKMYVSRAHPLSRRYTVISTAGGSAGNLLDHHTNEICERFRRLENRSDASNEEIIKKLSRKKPTYYVILPPPVPDNATMKALYERFPKLTFILRTGDELVPDPTLDSVDWLMPEVDLDTEDKHYADYEEALQIIRNIS